MARRVALITICALPVCVIVYYNSHVAWRFYCASYLPVHGELAAGKVAGKSLTSWRSDTYTLRVTYTRRGGTYVAETEVDSHVYRRSEIGQPIALFIDKEKPHRFVVKGDETYLIDTVKAGVADALLLIAALVFLGLWRKNRPAKMLSD